MYHGIRGSHRCLRYSASTSRVYNDPSHAPWQSVKMATAASTVSTTAYVSQPVHIPTGSEVAWYVHAEVAIPLTKFKKKTIDVSDSSPIRVQSERPAKSCEVPPVKFC